MGHGDAHAAGKKPRRVDCGLPPTTVGNPIIEIAAGDMHSLVLFRDGSVRFAWVFCAHVRFFKAAVFLGVHLWLCG